MSRTILAVDDSQSILETIKAELSALNPLWEVLCASNGRQCINILNKKDVDLILLDLMMPAIDGWDILARLKADNRTKNIPVIILTALTTVLALIPMGFGISFDYPKDSNGKNVPDDVFSP